MLLVAQMKHAQSGLFMKQAQKGQKLSRQGQARVLRTLRILRIPESVGLGTRILYGVCGAKMENRRPVAVAKKKNVKLAHQLQQLCAD